ncbi:hypothetical protein K443DRAFT_675390 [Laccaria amethystina LaAM-08-1]|uniref:Uncharacterized protein n=1 Tax=Laccaria amethystina LaAM-08-1 TaxID=1095629 RepID=A0A0C9YAP3_9AGAR|nr:hypothetical protein K443DRAFT_675390 [Laccaria amethystina LaAM-08-1]
MDNEWLTPGVITQQICPTANVYVLWTKMMVGFALVPSARVGVLAVITTIKVHFWRSRRRKKIALHLSSSSTRLGREKAARFRLTV